jgi:hypothetical protein
MLVVTVNTTWIGNTVCPGVLAVPMYAWPGLVVQVAYFGRSGQEKSIDPTQPPRELMVKVVVPGALAVTLMVVLDAATEKVEGSAGCETLIVELASQ